MKSVLNKTFKKTSKVNALKHFIEFVHDLLVLNNVPLDFKHHVVVLIDCQY